MLNLVGLWDRSLQIPANMTVILFKLVMNLISV